MASSAIILMADVIGSSGKPAVPLEQALRTLVARTNAEGAALLRSPLTITLGDEFQGVCASLDAAVDTVLMLERGLLTGEGGFRMRYVILEGDIETPVNPKIAYGMLGPGLTAARKLLGDKSRDRRDTTIRLEDTRRARLLEYVFEILQAYWQINTRRQPRHVLVDFIFDGLSDDDIAARIDKNRDQVWKYRKNWRIDTHVAAMRILADRLY